VKTLRDYIRAIQKNLATGIATERTYYSALEALLEEMETGITATNEPKRIECGAPDFIVSRGPSDIGCVEAKHVGANLGREERSEQIERYHSLGNLVLTDFLEFRWYVDGERRAVARLARVTRDNKIKADKAGMEAVRELLSNFLAHRAEPIGTSKELALRMAGQAHMIRDLIVAAFQKEPQTGPLHGQFKAFEEQLIPDLTPEQFADMYAQTIAYGLFAARCTWDGRGEFTRKNAAYLIPKTNPFLRDLFDHIAGVKLDDRIAWLVDFLAELLAQADMEAILTGFGRRTGREDPVVHFYETFLRAYDPEAKIMRGIFYTPDPVVSYIVRSADYLLKTRLDIPQGLADANVLILDPAAGTATFLYHVVNEIYDWLVRQGQKGLWDGYVAERLLPRIFGFELLMAPYAVAHLKMGLLLQDTGYKFEGDQRLGIYLTNALEEPREKYEVMGIGRFISEEGNEAAKIKREEPIMVVLGNPPYSVSSANKGEYIENLMERYKEAVREERNIQPLSDDYIKFIRFAHDRIERTGYGIIGMITNHAYLSGLIHRGIREELMKSFSEIYILNLHGSTIFGETTPDGGKDENIFDITPGVAIAFFVKKEGGDGPGQVKYADLWGLRERKYAYLADKDVKSTEWQELDPIAPYFFFVPKDFDLLSEYEQGWSVPDIFPVNLSGIKTHRDHFVFDFDEVPLHERISAFRSLALSDEQMRESFRLGRWDVAQAREKVRSDNQWEERFLRCLYRPFDSRWIFYSDDVIDRSRREVMRHMLHENVALLTMRRIREDEYRHFLVARQIVNKDAVSGRDNCNVFPLYLYPDDEGAQKKLEPEEGHRPNLNPEFIKALEEKLGLRFLSDGQGDPKETFGPEDVFYYAYAVFHSPTYRTRYEEFLKIDFPRLPLTSNRGLFVALVEKGAELVALHLMKSPNLNVLITKYPITGSNKVENVGYVEPHKEEGNDIPARVYINKTQYFEGIEPEVWNFHIGGYQVLNKWLKDRKGRQLSTNDLEHYQKIVVALKETMRLMEEIDTLIPSWPLV
jgi:predicted helicase